jgi:hypothetical protein
LKPGANVGAPQPAVQGDDEPVGPQASFLGATGRGRRICIIADNSGSMRPSIELVKQEVVRTLKALDAEQQFYVIFFNSQPMPQPTTGWLTGKRDVAKLGPWLQLIRAGGGTEPSPAFAMAFRLRPRPDMIFFLTDGIIPPTSPGEVARMNNANPKTAIHTILYNSSFVNTTNPKLVPLAIQRLAATLEQASQQLQQIARDSGGTFRTAGAMAGKLR